MQMVAIARALLGAPGLVLFDEPSQGLAPRIVQIVLDTIRRLKAEGIAVLIVEQNAEAALSVADRVYVLDRGRDRLCRSGRLAARRRAAPPRAAGSLTMSGAPILVLDKLAEAVHDGLAEAPGHLLARRRHDVRASRRWSA